MTRGGSYLRGCLYVLGATCAFIASNILLPHDWRAWAAFGFGTVANTCITWRAYLDGSHAKFQADKVITVLEPVVPTP